jgi:hypothetical protein
MQPLNSCIRALVLASFVVLPVIHGCANTPEQTGEMTPKQQLTGVRISEVCYWTKPGQRQWVEIWNSGQKPVDLQGWTVRNGVELNLVLAAQKMILAPGQYAVIVFDDTGQKSPGVAPGSLVIHASTGPYAEVLGSGGGRLALYSLAGNLGDDSMQSFVAWGPERFSERPGEKTLMLAALQAKLWSPSTWIQGSGQESLAGAIWPIRPGGSIGIVKPAESYLRESWIIFQADEVNPGRTGNHCQKPQWAFPGGLTYEKGIARFSMCFPREEVRFHFQIFRDKALTKLFEEGIQDNGFYISKKSIPVEATYYWRVRYLYPDGTYGKWMDTMAVYHRSY